MDGPYRLLSSILHTVSSGGGMAPFNASIWDLIHEGAWKYALTTFEKGRTFLLKRIVAVDGLNQGHNEGRAPATFAEQRTNLGKRLVEICLLGGTPVLFLDGQHASPGSGKYKQHAARAAVSPRFAMRRDLPARHPGSGERRGRLPLGLEQVRRGAPPADQFGSRQKTHEEVPQGAQALQKRRLRLGS